MYPATPSTRPKTRNMFGVNTSHTWISQGRDVSPTISEPCYHGFVIRPLSLISLGDPVVSQGTKVLEDREIRSRFWYVAEGAPQQQAYQSILKYTGTNSAPEWMDTEPGSVFCFNNFSKGVQAKQASTRHCVVYGRTFPPLLIRPSAEEMALCTTCGT